MRRFSITIAVILLAGMLLGLFGCANKTVENVVVRPLFSATPVNIKEVNGIQMWGAPNTLKVLRDSVINKLATDYCIAQGAKGESEGTQLILTPNKNVKKYSIEITDLKNNNGDILSRDFISLYMEKYVEVTKKSNTSKDWPNGFYPDALVPFHSAANVGENTLTAGQNQGIWIRFDIPQTQPKGIYKGTVNVTADGKKSTIDIYFQVFDFLMLQDIQMKTNAYTRHEWLIDGELDNTDEKYQKYYDFLLNYDISSTNLPGTRQYDKVDPKEFVETVKKYINNPKFTGYNLPATSEFIYSHDAPLQPSQKYGEKISGMEYGRIIADTDYDYLYQVIRELAVESTDKIDLLKPAYLYLVFIDEAGMSGSTWEVGNVYKQFTQVKEKLISDLKASDSNFFSSRISTLEDSIKNIPSQVTAPLDGLVNDYVDQLVPLINHYQSADERENMVAWKNEKKSRALWAYEAWIPANPYPAIHIDDSILAHRSIFWMMKNYGIEGYLYWGTAGYRGYKGDRLVPVDVYKDARTFDYGSASPNGDGFWLYPGEKYGIDGPVASIRLEAIRDGIEDYQYLYMLEKAFSDAEKQYGTEFNSEKILKTLYESIFSGVIYDNDISKLIAARSELAKMIEMINSEANAIIEVETPDVTTTQPFSLINVYSKKGFTVEAQGCEKISEDITGKGVKYQFKKELSDSLNYADIKIFNSNYSIEINKFIAPKIMVLSDFNSKEIIAKITPVRDNIQINPEPLQLPKSKVMSAIIMKDTGNSTKSVGIKLTKEDFFNKINFSNIDSLEFDVYIKGNTYGPQGPIAALGQSSKSIGINIEFVGENSKRTMSTIAAVENQWTHIKLGQIFSTNWEEIDKVSAILITITNSDIDQFDNKSIELYLEDLFVSFASQGK